MTQWIGQDDSVLVVEPAFAADDSPSRAQARPAGRLADYLALVKPRITTLVVITAYIGFAMGVAGHAWSWITLLGALFGTAFSCMGASVWNQLYERDTDALMSRTANRPLPAGRLRVAEATALAAILSLLGVGLLLIFANAFAATLAAATIITYALIYTPLKRVTSWSTAVGAIPGAAPPVIGFAAATGRVGIEAVLLFAIMFVWQLPHFFAIAWLYRDDYARAGLRMLPVVDRDGSRTFRQILITCFILIPLGVLPTLLRISGMTYFVTAMLAGVMFLWFGLVLMLAPTRKRAKSLFLASLVYLPVVLTVMYIDLI